MKSERDKLLEEHDAYFRTQGEILSILRSSGRSRPVNDFPVLEFYIKDCGSYPFTISFGEAPINHVEFMREFEEMVKDTLYTKESYDEAISNSTVEQGYYSLGKGYIMEITVGYHTLDNFSISVQELLRNLSKRDSLALVGNLTLYCPSNESPLKDRDLEERLTALIRKHMIPKNTTTPCIGMICMEEGEFYIKDFYIKKNYDIKNGDLHYGEGFTHFHERLLSRLKEDSKGLILFHGAPGTGKTYYIRSLIKDLLSLGKYVIYLPPNMVDSMVDPNMMNFLSTTVMEKSEENKSCVLLLEDAEPLLVSRKTETRSAGITNILNVTDGLLNDMLSIQVIATFNTDLSNIDEALLRPERLIARKEFKKLRIEDSKKLAEFLKIDKEITSEMTLAEIYSVSQEHQVLLHEYDQAVRKIGFK
jgi:hypothetical protein